MGLFDFVGDIFGGDTTVNVPGPSEEERRLQSLQAQQIEQQNRLINAMLPAMLSQSGLQPIYDSAGNLTRVDKLPETPEQTQQKAAQKKFLELSLQSLENELARSPQEKEIQSRLNERTLAALKGELPIDPALHREIGEQETVLREQMRKQLGPGWETSEPGMRALATFNQRKEELFSGARRADLTLSEQLAGARGASSFQKASGFLPATDLSERLRGSKLSELMSMSTAFNPGISNINPFLNRESSFRMGTGQLNLNSDVFNSQLQAATLFGIGDFAGTMFGGKK